MTGGSVLLILVVVILVALVAVILKVGAFVVAQYEVGVVLTLGRFSGLRKPGLRFIIPVLQEMELVDMREITLDVSRIEVITKDNVLVRINSVLNYRVHDPAVAVLEVQDVAFSTKEYSQSALRSVIGQSDLDEVSNTEKITTLIKAAIDDKVTAWGVKVSSVDIKELEVDQAMVRQISRQAEAERDRRAKVIESEGELQAAHNLSRAAEILMASPGAMDLRKLGTLTQLGNGPSNTIVFEMPADLRRVISAFVGDDDEKPSEVDQRSLPALDFVSRSAKAED